MTLAAAIERAASRIERESYYTSPDNNLVSATWSDEPDNGYSVRRYISNRIAPGEYRSDGMRTNPTAQEILSRLSPTEAAALIRSTQTE